MAQADDPAFDRLSSFAALCAAARGAARGKRLSREAAGFLCEIETEVLALQRELRAGSYAPRRYRTFEIREPKPRTISAAAFRDRVVHHALCTEIEPALERYATGDSYACRVGRGTHAALRRTRALVRRFAYVLKLDVLHFFETIDHDVLVGLIARRVAGARTRGLAEAFVRAGAPGSPPGKGVPIGNLTSQHFANLYLGPLDHFVRRTLRVSGYVRYMDDMLLFANHKAALWAAHGAVSRFADERLRLSLRPNVTLVLPCSEGVPFLGFRVFPGLVRLDPVRLRRFRRKMRALDRAVADGAVDTGSAVASAQSLLGWVSEADTRALLRSEAARWTPDRDS